jgi:serine/threonine-protein kinase
VSYRFTATSMVVETAGEAGDTETVRASSLRFLRRVAAWTPASPIEAAMVLPIVRAAGLSGALSEAEYAKTRAAWIAKAEANLAGITDGERRVVWMYAYGASRTKAEAEQAIGALARYPSPGAPDVIPSANAAILGGNYLLAGDAKGALPYLRRASRTCSLLNVVRIAFSARVWLANAIVMTGGDHEEARALYQSVLDRWGNAKPRSVTAESIRAKLAAL